MEANPRPVHMVPLKESAEARSIRACGIGSRSATGAWREMYSGEEEQRVKDIRLLCGTILPIWPSLTAALKVGASGRQRREGASLPVKKCVLDGQPMIGVALNEEQVCDARS